MDKTAGLNGIIATIEDGLVNAFSHHNRTSSIYMEGRSHDMEVSYDALTGKVDVVIYSEDAHKDYPNICRMIEDGISTDKIDNEIRLGELHDDEEYDAEADNRMALDRAHGWGYGMFWK